jgi:hypothetical protein
MNCKNSKTESLSPKKTIPNISLKEFPEAGKIKLSDLGAKEIIYIPLETSERCVIQGIKKVISCKDYFLTEYQNDINMFRYDGTFICKIGTQGRGPNEFTVAHCLDINPKDETIYLIDGWQQKFIVFSSNGKFIRTFKYPFREDVDFRVTEDGIICYNMDNMGITKTSFVFIDTTGQVIKSYPNRYPWTRNFPTYAFDYENVFYKKGSTLVKKEMYCDTLYAFINKQFEPYLVIQTDDKLRVTPKVRSETTLGPLLNDYINPGNLFEFNDFIYYEFSIPESGKAEGYTFIGSKDGKIRVLIDDIQRDIINDLDGGPINRPKTVLYDGSLVFWIDAIDIKTYVSSEIFRKSNPKYPDRKKKLEDLVNSLKDTDNPVLVLLKF